jgi:hypothetical protein
VAPTLAGWQSEAMTPTTADGLQWPASWRDSGQRTGGVTTLARRSGPGFAVTVAVGEFPVADRWSVHLFPRRTRLR